MLLKSLILPIIGLAVLSTAHPAEHEKRDEPTRLQRREYHSRLLERYGDCNLKLEKSGVNKRAAARRQNIVDGHRRQFQQTLFDPTRPGPYPDSKISTPHDDVDLPDPLRKSHLVTDTSITLNTPESVLFAANRTCVLNPEGKVGPFYVRGEHIRSDITDGQLGIPMILDAQLIDVETCEPLRGAWWDIWTCNSTGVYSGVSQHGNGDESDTSNLNATFLRGLQETDDDGVAKFRTVFPGHYNHRTTHLHVVTHIGDVTRLPNNTVVGGTVAHIGQLFWDQDLIDEVEATYPYTTNLTPITRNVDDDLFLEEVVATTSDPVVNYVKLGDDIQDGILAWISVAVNRSASFDPSYSYKLTRGGGVAESGGDSPI
jgi:protocatechuate 3,4-dioxygenase beta subunit